MAARLVGVLLLVLAVQQAGQNPAEKYAKLHATLFRAIGDRQFDDELDASLRVLTPEARAEVERRLERRDSYRPRTTPPSGPRSFELKVVDGRRTAIETAIVALLETDNTPPVTKAEIEHEAVEFVRQANLAYEWEGFPDGPLDEAASAAAYLDAHPSTVLRPYLDLYLLHRYRCAFEAAGLESRQYPVPPSQLTPEKRAEIDSKNRADQQTAAAKYVEVWRRLDGTTDPVVRAIADELDGVPLVYVGIGVHPRTFVPR